jgi:hypothetical protein
MGVGARDAKSRAKEAGLTFSWVKAVTVYGQAVDLRTWRCRSKERLMFWVSLAFDSVCVQAKTG